MAMRRLPWQTHTHDNARAQHFTPILKNIPCNDPMGASAWVPSGTENERENEVASERASECLSSDAIKNLNNI